MRRSLAAIFAVGLLSYAAAQTYPGGGPSGIVNPTGPIQFVTANPGIIKSVNFGSLNYWGSSHVFFDYAGNNGTAWMPQSDGVFTLTNIAGTSFGRMQLGGTTSAFPSIKRNGVAPESRLADDSASTGFIAASYQPGIVYSAAGTPVPACAAGTNGWTLIVSDSTAPTYRSAYTSGGAVVSRLLCVSGTGWLND